MSQIKRLLDTIEFIDRFCSGCSRGGKRFRQEFPNWTSGNRFIDGFIQETQQNVQPNAQQSSGVLEWIS